MQNTRPDPVDFGGYVSTCKIEGVIMEFISGTRKLSLNIDGYEYPSAVEGSDANWLVIAIKAKCDGEIWQAKAPCMRASELIELRAWLNDLPSPRDGRIDFTENELTFLFDARRQVILVLLDFHFHPKGDAYQYLVDRGYAIEFDMRDVDVGKLTSALDDLIKNTRFAS